MIKIIMNSTGIVTITPNAAEKIKALMAKEGKDGYILEDVKPVAGAAK